MAAGMTQIETMIRMKEACHVKSSVEGLRAVIEEAAGGAVRVAEVVRAVDVAVGEAEVGVVDPAGVEGDRHEVAAEVANRKLVLVLVESPEMAEL